MSSKSKLIDFPARKKPLVRRTLSSGGYEAEFFTDPSADFPVVHYVVSRKGEAEILAWGQESSMEAAQRAAMDAMHDMYKRHTAAG